MLDYINEYLSSPVATIISYIIGLAGFILTFVFYFKSKKNKAPVYMENTRNLIGTRQSTTKDIEIKFKSKPIKFLNLTTISFWNMGNLPLLKSDIASADPIKIILSENSEIFDFFVDYKDEVNGITLALTASNTLVLTFEYLDFNEGVVFSFYHNSPEGERIKLQGTVIATKIKSYREVYNKIDNSMDWLTNPVQYLLDHRFIILKFIGGLLILPTLLILLPIAIILAPIKYITRRYRSPKKEFIVGYL
ncbi:MAG: hypothetical protein AAGB30_11070 [Pedobacter sp.]